MVEMPSERRIPQPQWGKCGVQNNGTPETFSKN